MAGSNQRLSQSLDRTVIISVALVGILAALSTVYDYLHLELTDRLNDYSRFAIITLSIFLPSMIAIALLSRGRYLRLAIWSVFVFGSFHLLSFVAVGLFIDNDVPLAVEHAIWVLALEVCLFATLKRQTALVLSCLLYGALIALVVGFTIFYDLDPIKDPREGSLIQLLIANAAILVLLGGLSSFREFALMESARATASEENAVLLEANAELADAERKKALHALKNAEKAAQARDSFLASMSHELRTPLNAIIGFSQILELGGEGLADTPEKRKEYVTDIRHSGEHMLSLVTQILEYSQLNSEGCELYVEKLSVTDVALSAIRMMDVLASGKHVPLLRQWDRRYDFEVETDERALSQILVNLLSNAVKFTPEGGLICVSIDFDEDGGVKIEIHDNGIGIPPDKIASVGDPFFQVNDQRSTGTEGTGLGLSIVNSLVRELGGRFEIESTLGEGTCCRVRLPLKAGMSALAETPQQETQFAAAGS